MGLARSGCNVLKFLLRTDPTRISIRHHLLETAAPIEQITYMRQREVCRQSFDQHDMRRQSETPGGIVQRAHRRVPRLPAPRQVVDGLADRTKPLAERVDRIALREQHVVNS
ncbi:MAG: hypothetical protein JZU55_01620, partial [Afipia sp.]|nr:hypothetical protein [Afipia sp.]